MTPDNITESEQLMGNEAETTNVDNFGYIEHGRQPDQDDEEPENPVKTVGTEDFAEGYEANSGNHNQTETLDQADTDDPGQKPTDQVMPLEEGRKNLETLRVKMVSGFAGHREAIVQAIMSDEIHLAFGVHPTKIASMLELNPSETKYVLEIINAVLEANTIGQNVLTFPVSHARSITRVPDAGQKKLVVERGNQIAKAKSGL